MKSERNKQRKEPSWKTRLEKKRKERRQDLSRLDEIFRGRFDCQKYFLRKYHLDKNTVEEVNEMLKPSIIAVSAKIKRFTDRTTQYHHNKLFEKDQKMFYEMLEGKKQAITQPDADEAKRF